MKAWHDLENATNFGQAIETLKAGGFVQRAGWNGKGMWLALIIPGREGEDSILLDHVDPVGCFGFSTESELRVDPVIAMRTAQITLQLGWLASQADMLADDWQVVDPNAG